MHDEPGASPTGGRRLLDISDRKMVELALRESEARLQSMLDDDGA